MKKFSLILLALLLTGCVTTNERVVIQEVKVPVMVNCEIDWPAAPKHNIGKDPAPSGVYDKTVKVLAEHEEYRRYSSELNAALQKCATPKKAP